MLEKTVVMESKLFSFSIICVLLLCYCTVNKTIFTLANEWNNVNDSGGILRNDASHNGTGHATETIIQSHENLNGKTSNKNDFRARASEVLTAMLESRLNDQNSKLKEKSDGTSYQCLSGKILFEQSRKIAASAADACVYNNSHNSNAAIADPTNANIANNGPSFDLSLPSPSPMLSPPFSPIAKISLLPPRQVADIDTEQNSSPSTENNSVSVQEEKSNSAIDDDSCYIIENFDKNDTVDGISANLYPQQNGYDNVVSHNKNIKPELTTHARDRRSYIGDNYRHNNYNNVVTSQTTEIASGLKDGKHPICSVCHVKIAR